MVPKIYRVRYQTNTLLARITDRREAGGNDVYGVRINRDKIFPADWFCDPERMGKEWSLATEEDWALAMMKGYYREV